MFSEESARYMSMAAVAQPVFGTNIAKFFSSYKTKQPVWDMLAFLYHRSGACLVCKYRYAGHAESIERGRVLLKVV